MTALPDGSDEERLRRAAGLLCVVTIAKLLWDVYVYSLHLPHGATP